VPDKGIETFLACAEKLKNNFNYYFVIGGEGPLRKKYENDVKQLKLGDSVVFVGYIEDVVPYYNAFDLFCLPTLREGFGVVFVEAQSCGVPVIGSNIPSLREIIIDGKTGRIVEKQSIDGFAKAINDFSVAEVRTRYGCNGRNNIIANFNEKNMHKKIICLYEQLMKKKST